MKYFGYLIILLLVIGAGVYLVRSKGQLSQPIACTEEAKICPDGSAVGRTGPKCEFAQCPGTQVVNAAAFFCDGNKSIKAKFYPGNDTKVDLELSDGRTLSLPHAISASGARYANADEAIVFWNKGDTAFITEGASTTYENCVTPDVKNLSYVVDGETFDLKNGKAEKEAAPGSATKNTLTLFGEPVYGDLTGEGRVDAAVLLVNNPGGSGTFYYAALVINKGTNYQATKAMLLGDRIAPQTVEIREGRAVYNFAERKAGEPMTAQPSIGKSVWVQYDKKTGEIGEWVKDFEGESH